MVTLRKGNTNWEPIRLGGWQRGEGVWNLNPYKTKENKTKAKQSPG